MNESKKKEKNNDNKIKVSFSVYIFSVILVLAGLMLYFVPKFNNDTHIWDEFFENICGNIGMTLFSAGLISLILEVSTIKSVVNAALKDILNCSVPLDAYSDEKLCELNNRIAATRLSVDEKFIKKSVYKMQENLLQISNGLFYEYHNVKCYITPDEANNVFHKKVIMTYKIINKFNNNNVIQHDFSLFDTEPQMSDERRKEKFRVNTFRVNQTDLMHEVENCISITPIPKKENSVYQYEVKFFRGLQKCKEHTIHLEFEYDVPISDLTQVFKVVLPCNRLEHTVILTSKTNSTINNWKLIASAFTSFYCSKSEESGFDVEIEPGYVKVNFKDWTIPGAGYVIFFNKIR